MKHLKTFENYSKLNEAEEKEVMEAPEGFETPSEAEVKADLKTLAKEMGLDPEAVAKEFDELKSAPSMTNEEEDPISLGVVGLGLAVLFLISLGGAFISNRKEIASIMKDLAEKKIKQDLKDGKISPMEASDIKALAKKYMKDPALAKQAKDLFNAKKTGKVITFGGLS